MPQVMDEKNDSPGKRQHEPSTSPSSDAADGQKKTHGRKWGLDGARSLWAKWGLNIPILLIMFKGGLPPAIAIAIYQATAVAKTYATLGYFIAIVTVLAPCVMPRAIFLQTLVLNVLVVCLGACIGLLTAYCATQARAHTFSEKSGYNSSASAVSAIWLIFSLYWANTLRAKWPQFQLPAIVYSIFAIVSGVYAPSFANMAAGKTFVVGLLKSFLSGLAISAAVSLFILPTTSRAVVFKDTVAYIGALREALQAQAKYLHAIARRDMLSPAGAAHHAEDDQVPPDFTREAAPLQQALTSAHTIHGKLRADLTFGKRETAYGKLDAQDLKDAFQCLRMIMLPLLGLGTTVAMFERLQSEDDTLSEGQDERSSEVKQEAKREARQEAKQDGSRWSETIETIKEPLTTLTEAMDEGLQHVLYALELTKPPKASKAADVEAQKQAEPEAVAKNLEQKCAAFYDHREVTLKAWCDRRRVPVPTIPEGQEPTMDHVGQGSEPLSAYDRKRLYIILYLNFLIYTTGRSVLGLVRFADAKVADGTMKRARWISPGWRRLKEWIVSLFTVEDSSMADHTPDNEGTSVDVGDSYHKKKDPEHLPPATRWERLTSGFGAISKFFSSPASGFGLRVVVATMSLGILAYVQPTQAWFLHQRGIWGLIMVAFSMTPTAGSGLFGFFCRLVGTIIAMVFSYIMWYIVDGKTPGIIVFLYLFISIEHYFFIKYPRLLPAVIITMITQVLIIGYELQVEKVGIPVAQKNGQEVYPIYKLAPLRVLIVAAGLAAATFWTFFPYPVTARSQLRKDLGSALYLLANFYSCIHTTLRMRLLGEEGDAADENSPGRLLDHARLKVFAKLSQLLASMKQHIAFSAWEPTVGGKFPRATYSDIVRETENLGDYLALIGYSSRAFTYQPGDSSEAGRRWNQDMLHLLTSIKVTSHGITSMLSLLATSVSNGVALPPYLEAPRPYGLSEKLEQLDSDLLSINHMAEPGYSAFAVTQVAASMISYDLDKLIDNVKSLVGEVDFSYHIVSTGSSSDEALDEDWRKKFR